MLYFPFLFLCYVPTIVLRSRSGDNNSLMPAARELMMLNRQLIVPGVGHAMPNIVVNLCLLVLRPRGSMVLQGSRIMSAPGILRSTPPVHRSKWWRILKGLIFSVKLFIPALVEHGGGLVVAPSLFGSQFDSKQCCEQFVTPMSSFHLSRCNSLTFRTPVRVRLLLDLHTYDGVDPLGVFPLYLTSSLVFVIFFACCSIC